jgi:dipeptidyl aminopeptidase/acylaminoacyl peptidase
VIVQCIFKNFAYTCGVSKTLWIALGCICLLILGLVVILRQKASRLVELAPQTGQSAQQEVVADNPLSIAAMRARTYPGSPLVIEQTLATQPNYSQYIASYQSDGLKIYGLLTVPKGTPPTGGWPAIIFNHGYIPPTIYKTTERYVAYVDAFARNGYVVFKPDYRGNGNSQGQPEGAYYSPAYATDSLNALASVQQYPGVNPQKIGMWGHSMGGNVTLRSLVVRPNDIKVAVIWGGVVGNYDDIMNHWQNRVRYHPPPQELALRNNDRQTLINTYGTPTSDPTFWNTIDPTAFLSDIKAPIQLHVGGNDEEVPPDFSQSLYAKLQALGKTVEFYSYPGGDHNISAPNFDPAMARSIAFFDTYLK